MNESPLDFPKQADKTRIDRYKHYDLIYAGEHHEAFKIKRRNDESPASAKLRYIVANFGGLISRVMADMLFDEPPTVDMKDESSQRFIERFIERNELVNQLYESALVNSRRGDSLFKLRIGKMHPSDKQTTLIAEELPAAIYFPVIEGNNTRNKPTEDVIGWIFKRNGESYLHKEIHSPGLIRHEVYFYNEQEQRIVPGQLNVAEFGFAEEEETRATRSLIFHIPNVRDGSGYFGTSDYADLETLFYALNNRLTSIDRILDKHGDPILAVPPGVIDENGKVRKESLGMYEVDNENPGFNKPEYIVWDANMESAFNQIDKMIDLLCVLAEVSPDSIGRSGKDGGLAESGRALKFKLLTTIRKRNRKKRYYDQALKDMLQTALELGKAWSVAIDSETVGQVERPTIKWADGVINDEVEQVETETAKVDAGLSSRADSIARLDNITPTEAKKKVAEIDAENAPAVPAISNALNGNGTGGVAPPTNPREPQPAVRR